MLEIGWFSGMDDDALELFQGVLEAIRNKSINVSISWVFCNNYSEEVIRKIQDIIGDDNISVIFRDSNTFKTQLAQTNPGEPWRDLYDEEVFQALQCSIRPDIVVLAGYMLFVNATLHEYYNMINLHPALPEGPKGAWRKVTQAVVEQGLEKTGTMIHGVTDKPDDPEFAVSFCEVCVKGCDVCETRRRQYRQEIFLLIETLKRLANGTMKMGDKPVDLTESIVRMLNS